MSSRPLVLHEHARETLTELARNPTHAILLTGPLGSGKTHHARTLALRLLGDLPDSQNLPNLRVISGEKGSISIEQIRVLIRFFRLKVPGNAAVGRVAIIEDAHTMGLEAQNALLKMLEEPPQGSILILTSSDPQVLLPTIRSRVQTAFLPAPDHDQLTSHFITQGHDRDVVSGVLLRAGSNVAEAERLLTDTETDQAMQTVKQALKGTTFDRLVLVDALSKQKEAAANFIDTLAMVATVSLNTAANKNPTGIPRWHAILQSAYTAQDALAKNGNTKLVLTELMLTI